MHYGTRSSLVSWGRAERAAGRLLLREAALEIQQTPTARRPGLLYAVWLAETHRPSSMPPNRIGDEDPREARPKLGCWRRARFSIVRSARERNAERTALASNRAKRSMRPVSIGPVRETSRILDATSFGEPQVPHQAGGGAIDRDLAKALQHPC